MGLVIADARSDPLETTKLQIDALDVEGRGSPQRRHEVLVARRHAEALDELSVFFQRREDSATPL